MQISCRKDIKKRVVFIEIETTGFTSKENKALDLFGEPDIVLEKNYGGFPVSINKRIRSGFKVKVKFDGTKDIEAAIDAANNFYEEIQEKLETAMTDVIELMDTLGFEPSNTTVQLTRDR